MVLALLTSKEKHTRIIAAFASEPIDDTGESDQEVENITPDLGHRETLAIFRFHELIRHILNLKVEDLKW